MVQSPVRNHRDILFRNEPIQPFLGIIALGHPSAQVHAPVKPQILHLHCLFPPNVFSKPIVA